jgi:hypothetical protein
VIDDGVRRYVALVELQERESRRIRAPPERAESTTSVDFLLVEPVQLAVQDVVAAVGGQRALDPRFDLDDEEVVGADERDEAPIGLNMASSSAPTVLVRRAARAVVKS